MAWTNLTYAFGSLLTSAKMTQLDDNFEALAAGDSGAPKIQGDNALTVPTTGATYRHAQIGVEDASIGATTYTRLGTQLIMVPRTGVYQLSFGLKSSNGTYTASGRVYRNPASAYGGEVAFGAEQTTTSTTFVEKTEASLSLNAGDVLVLYAKSSNALGDTTVNDFTLESAVKPMG